MPLLLVDGLEPADAAALRSHLATGCPRCAGYLAEASATISFLPFALEPVAAPGNARQKLFDRIQVEAPPAATIHEPRSPVVLRILNYFNPFSSRGMRTPGWIRQLAPVAAAACIAIIATAGFMLPKIHSLQTALSNSHQKNYTLTTQSLAKDQYLHLVRADELRLINMQGRAQPKAMARAIWDGERQVWRFFAKNLEPLSKRETYELWFITPYGRKVPAATFSVDETGSAEIFVPAVRSDVGPIEAAMVTDEPHVGTFAPTGSIHLFGKLE